MSSTDFERIVLLNRLVSRSPTRAPQEHRAPLHSGEELLGILAGRVANGHCQEFLDREINDDDDDTRIAANSGKNFIRVSQIATIETPGWNYTTLLIDYVDMSLVSFPVVDVVKRQGRDLAGEENERGSFSAHVVVRLPKPGAYDDGTYRCVIEAVTNLSRKRIEYLLSRQLRRHAKANDWSFSVVTSRGKKSEGEQSYRYHPKLELFADVGRSLFGGGGAQKQLSHIVFTNRSEKQAIAQATAVTHEDVYAAVEYRISAKQGPSDPAEQRSWLASLKAYYQGRGYETKMYFRHIKGDKTSGSVHPALDDASDLLMCPRESIFTKAKPGRFVGSISAEVRDLMRELLDRDELWLLKKSA